MASFREENGWLIDDRGNRASLSYWGTREAAERSLRSLEDCDKCVNCSRCSGCSGCSDCSRCSDCSGCSGCSRCSDCSGCSDCSDCSDCSRCSDCSDCSRCSDCSGCSGCSRCSDCSGCSGCSDCSGCSGCSDCSRCSDLSLKTGVTATELGATNSGPPPVPTIPNIHSAIYAAASRKGALDMGDWHKCAKTHCRAGWAVTLAGKDGAALEAFYNTPLAAMLIYDASDPAFKINPGRFFDENDDALADMKRLADAEQVSA